MSNRLEELGPLIDAGPTRAHVARLRSFDVSVRTIHRLSGVSMKSLGSLIWGTEGRPPTGQVRQETADRLFAVQIRPELFAPGTKIGATGTARRLQALQTVGWSTSLLAVELVTTKEYIRKLSFGRFQRVLVTTALTTREVYERLWDKQPPQATPNQQGSATRVRNKAARLGWAPPMAWDDDSIDDPAAQPQGVAKPNLKRRLPSVDELAWLMDQGETQEAIAMRFKVHVKSLKSAQIRAHRKAAA
jgi:hypothetical protein